MVDVSMCRELHTNHNTLCGCWSYIVNGVAGGDEVGDVTGDDVW